MDFFVYQSRYHWNDLRGFYDDIENGKKRTWDKIAVEAGKDKLVVCIIAGVMFAKTIAAGILIGICFSGACRICLYLGMVGIFILGACYEAARERQEIWKVLFLVGFGYPLRMLIGILITCPELIRLLTDNVFDVIYENTFWYVLGYMKNGYMKS